MPDISMCNAMTCGVRDAEMERLRSHPVFAFLQGSAPLNGCWFGDPPPPGERGNFWWRKHLTEALKEPSHDEG